MGFADVSYRFEGRVASLQGRLIYFETDGWASRLYSFENDLQNNQLSPPFYGQGWRWYVNGKLNIKKIAHLSRVKMLSMGLKIAQTIVPDREATESVRNETSVSAEWEFRFQFLLGW